MWEPQIRDTDDLWRRVAELERRLRESGSQSDADRLHRAVTISAHPGEVWPETLAVIRALMVERPAGFDEVLARACADVLSRWP